MDARLCKLREAQTRLREQRESPGYDGAIEERIHGATGGLDRVVQEQIQLDKRRANAGNRDQAMADVLYTSSLFERGLSLGYDLANPVGPLPRHCASYDVFVARHKVKVCIAKRCYYIYDSPPATAMCQNAVNPSGD